MPNSETSYYNCFVKVVDGLDVIDGSNLTGDFISVPFNTELIITSKKDIASSYVLLFEIRDKNGLVCLDQTLTVLINKDTGQVIDGSTDKSGGDSNTSLISKFDPNHPIESLKNFVDLASNVFDCIKYALGCIPGWISSILSIMLIMLVIITVIRAITGKL